MVDEELIILFAFCKRYIILCHLQKVFLFSFGNLQLRNNFVMMKLQIIMDFFVY